VATILMALPLVAWLQAVTPSAPAPAPMDSVARDTTRRSPHIVRQFPAIEVRAPIHDLGSSESVHLVTPMALRELPVDQLRDVIQTQAGVVVEGEELHVRGGRPGELDQVVEGVTLNDPLRHRPMDVPVLALRGVELISGGQDAEHGGALAGVLQMRTQDPTPRWSDAGLDTHYDQGSARVGGLLVAGLGVVAAADVMGDDTWLPTVRANRHRDLLGLRIGWRAENRILGWAKLAPMDDPSRASVQVFASRELHEPWDPSWTKDGWYTPCADDSCTRPGWSDTEPTGPGASSWTHYTAASHLAVTDERRLGTIVNLSRTRPSSRTSVSLGWVHASSVRSPNGLPGDGFLYAGGPPVLGFENVWENPFYVYWGDDPLYRETRSDQLSLRADHGWAPDANRTARVGAGITYDALSLHELDATTFGKELDSLRAFHVYAPGGFAYAQTRWKVQGMVLNVGLRGQLFSAGPQASHGFAEPAPHARLSLSPRLGIAYPVSVRDVFSLAYVRLEQDPNREFLYDNRSLGAVSNRAPLGNPNLVPATVVSYQGAVKHVFTPTSAAQIAGFFRDVYGQVGARNYAFLPGAYELRYTNEDEGHVIGFEVSLLHENDRRHAELHYTWMEAYGNESRPEGDPYGFVRGPRTPPLMDSPLSWDRRHTLGCSGYWPMFERWTVSWSTVLGSSLPWTPKPRRAPIDTLAEVNSARLGISENTDISVRWDPPVFPIPLSFGFEVRNLFDNRTDRAATVDGYPHAVINTVFDDYSAYRTETGEKGGAYWYDLDGDGTPEWVPVHDPRLLGPPRRLRLSVGARW